MIKGLTLYDIRRQPYIILEDNNLASLIKTIYNDGSAKRRHLILC